MKKTKLSLWRTLLSASMLLTGFCGGLSAQETKTVNFWDHWFAGIGGGGRIYFGDHNRQMKFEELLSPGGDVFVGKWWSPVVGTRLGYSVQNFKGATQNGSHSTGKVYDASQWLSEQKFTAGHLYGDVLFDLSNLFFGVNENRFWSVSPYVGVGWLTSYESPHSREVSSNLGLLNAFRLSRTLDFTLDIRGAMVNDRFDGEIGGRREEGFLSVNAGLTIRFGGRGWSCGDDGMSEAERLLLNERITAMAGENAGLRDQLASASGTSRLETIVEKVTEWKDVAADVLVLFPINSSVLSKDARVQLGFLSELMNKYPSGTYTITGYADASTGNVNLNNRLSQARAEAVKQCLVNEFGLSPSRLSTVAAGGVGNRYYDDPALSRSVVIRPDK